MISTVKCLFTSFVFGLLSNNNKLAEKLFPNASHDVCVAKVRCIPIFFYMVEYNNHKITGNELCCKRKEVCQQIEQMVVECFSQVPYCQFKVKLDILKL